MQKAPGVLWALQSRGTYQIARFLFQASLNGQPPRSRRVGRSQSGKAEERPAASRRQSRRAAAARLALA
jgi:hypothetical protein